MLPTFVFFQEPTGVVVDRSAVVDRSSPTSMPPPQLSIPNPDRVFNNNNDGLGMVPLSDSVQKLATTPDEKAKKRRVEHAGEQMQRCWQAIAEKPGENGPGTLDPKLHEAFINDMRLYSAQQWRYFFMHFFGGQENGPWKGWICSSGNLAHRITFKHALFRLVMLCFYIYDGANRS